MPSVLPSGCGGDSGKRAAKTNSNESIRSLPRSSPDDYVAAVVAATAAAANYSPLLCPGRDSHDNDESRSENDSDRGTGQTMKQVRNGPFKLRANPTCN